MIRKIGNSVALQLIIIVVSIVVVCLACFVVGGAGFLFLNADGPQRLSVARQEITPMPPTINTLEPAPTFTPELTSTATPTPAILSMSTDRSVPVGGVVLLELEGVGATVSDHYDLPACHKAVFYWTSAAGKSDMSSLILSLHKVREEQHINLVNESEGISGSVLESLMGGEYYFTAENTDNSWSMRVECQDGQVPVETGINLQGVGRTVTENYELPACEKSAFIWSVEPDEMGNTSLTVQLYGLVDEAMSVFPVLVDVSEVDRTEPLTGEALQSLYGGWYFLTTDNASGPWSITWECRD